MMTLEDYKTASKPKVQGTWNLHELLLDVSLDFFITLSSISGFGGNSSQANYAAGCTFQDALARYRTAHNLPAVSINLGMIKSVGVLVGNKKAADRLRKLGLRSLEEDEVLRLIEAAVVEPFRSVENSQIITGIPASFERSDSTVFWNSDIRFSALERVAGSTGPNIETGELDNLKSQLTRLSDRNEATACVVAALRKKLSEMFVIPESEVDPTTPLGQLGVDSLIAVELRNWVAVNAQAECSIFDVIQSPSLKALAEKVVGKSKVFTIAS
jgi:KR domain-containing protein/phosphopantetheine binding protein